MITTTTGARYYGLHALAWADAHDRGLDSESAEEFVRRCEVVMAAASLAHGAAPGGHFRVVPSAHGSDRIPQFIHGDVLDVVAAAARDDGFSKGGFAATYRAPEGVIGLVLGSPPRKGPRTDLGRLKAGLGDVLTLAREDTLTADAIAHAAHLCPCLAAEAPDGQWLRSVMFGQARADVEGDHNRQVSALMLLEALDHGPHHDPESRFRLAHGFGAAMEGEGLEARARRAWQAAILRNYSVSAWRHLWRWLSLELVGDTMTAHELGDRLADALNHGKVRTLIDELPQRADSSCLLPIEEELHTSDEDVPVRSLRQLALGALRLDDLDGDTRNLYVGVDRDDLGPLWVQHQLTEHADGALSDFARDLVQTLVRRAWRVAHSKMRLSEDLRPYVPTGLRDRDGLLSVVDAESDAEVSLRGWTLAQVLGALGAVDRPDGQYTVSPLGDALRGQISASVARVA
ncbi:MAG: hypothetical protein ACR2OB_10340 [Solirubrobacteraceae bacterium]